MTTLTRKTVLTLSSSLALLAFVAMSANAAQPKALLIAPEHDDYCLPQFGFSSFSIHGVGERVTYVRRFGLAARMGLEPGDTILSMNGIRLTYHGAWDDALGHALAGGGWVHLHVRDVRTGRLAHRDIFVGDEHVVGPITPKMHVGRRPLIHHEHHVGYPVGPITPKSKPGHHHDKHHDVNKTIKKIAKLFD